MRHPARDARSKRRSLQSAVRRAAAGSAAASQHRRHERETAASKVRRAAGCGVGPRTPISSFEDGGRSTGQAVVSDLTIGPETRKPTVLAGLSGARRRRRGRRRARPRLNLSACRRCSRYSAAGGSVITLTDRQGRVLARSRDAEQSTSARPIGRAATRRRRRRRRTAQDLDGVERASGVVMVGARTWVLSVGIPDAASRSSGPWPLWRRNIAIPLRFARCCSLALWLSTG